MRYGLLLVVGLVWWRQRRSRWGELLFELAASMLVHVSIDIFTHRSDGPLLWFPIDWVYRFPSPTSYWESAYGGRAFATFELMLDLALLAYLATAYWPAVRTRWRKG